MNKRQFAATVAVKFRTSIANALEMIDWFTSLIEENLISGKEVNLQWFGKFNIVTRSWRNWVNPRTMEKIQVPWYTTVHFKVWSSLKRSIQNKFN